MKRKIALLVTPLLFVALAELIFRLGAWEPVANPESHAGTSVRLKRNLLNPAMPKIDFVTLGSSRPEYGIDHARLAEEARQHGFVHANLSMPGSHWMTIGVLAQWLEKHHPEVRGGIIALSIQDMIFPGNGNYELGIVQPFRDASDTPWINAHVPFKRDDIESYGSYSALFGWRDDVRDLLRHPSKRIKTLEWFARNRSLDSLFTNPGSQGNMCAHGLGTLAACDAIERSSDASDNLRRQCTQVRTELRHRPDFGKFVQQDVPPEFMLRTRELVQSQLRAMHWKTPPIVVLMPVPRVWRNDDKTAGQRQWTLSILQPLVDEGHIELIDATDFFDADSDLGCSKFFDFYHQNAEGSAQLTAWLLPRLKKTLYPHP
jgi:hypothetical protein